MMDGRMREPKNTSSLSLCPTIDHVGIDHGG